MWIIYALLSPAVYAITNFIDKYLLSRKVKDYNALPIYTASVSFLFGLIWWISAGSPLLQVKDTIIIMITGVITIFAMALYFKALSTQETSVVILLFQLTPIFTLLLSAIFLKEPITIKQYTGFAVVFTATFLLALPKKRKSWQLPQGFWLIILYNIMFASVGIILKYITYKCSFSQIIAYESFGIGVGGVFIYFFIPAIRNAFLKSRKLLFKTALPIIIINEILFIIAKSLGYFAFVIGPVALVSVLSNVQTFYGLLFGWGLTTLLPRSFKEDLSKEGIMMKVTSAILLFIGLYLMV